MTFPGLGVGGSPTLGRAGPDEGLLQVGFPIFVVFEVLFEKHSTVQEPFSFSYLFGTPFSLTYCICLTPVALHCFPKSQRRTHAAA